MYEPLPKPVDKELENKNPAEVAEQLLFMTFEPVGDKFNLKFKTGELIKDVSISSTVEMINQLSIILMMGVKDG